MSGPYALTVVAPIDSERRAALDAALAEIARDLDGNRLVPFGALGTTHFARFVILPPAPPWARDLLVFESNHDGEPDEYLDHLARVAGAGLDAIFGCCVGWPAGGVADVDAYGAFMRAHRRPAAAFHMGYRGYGKATVKNDLAVYEAVEAWLDEAEPDRSRLAERGAMQLRGRIARDVARRAPKLSLAAAGPSYRTLLIALLAVPLAPVIFPTYAALALLLRGREQRDPVETVDDPPIAIEELNALHAIEDHVVQNQLTHLAIIKPGRLRRFALRFALWVVNLASRFLYNQGHLGGITSIHFARWVILDDGRLLFLSNYDGSWESYLGEFVDRAHIGLTGVWSHTTGFPRTRFMICDGATDEEAFKRWTRRRQLPTQVWYSSYPESSIDNIRNAIAVREGLRAHCGEKECRAWLTRL
jgi:hypothetical protein